jgi:syntaxin-binding protein 1
MREVYQLSDSLHKDIVIGSTHVVTPKGFVDDLKVLDLGGAGSKAIPNGLRDMKGDQKPPQQLYDEKYYLKDAPAPQRVPAKTLAPRAVVAPPMQPSPTHSYQGSVTSMTPSVKDDKKKKRGLFGRFS